MGFEKMEGADGNPQLKMEFEDGGVATVCFSDRESDHDVKGRVRGILTSAYEERMNNLIMGNES